MLSGIRHYILEYWEGEKKMQIADMVLKGMVFTALQDEPFEGGVAVNGNKIAAVCTGSGIDGWIGPETKVYDCPDRLIMPGFIDAHEHLFIGAIASSEHMTTDIAASVSEEDCLRIIGEYYRSHPDEVRIRAQGWFLNNWGNAPLPSRYTLDKVIPDKPAYLLSADGHTCWVNTRGLEELGYDENTVLENGEICLGEDGKPTGILCEVGRPVFDIMYTLPFPQMKQAEADFFKGLARCGVTTISDMDTTKPTPAMRGKFDAAKELEQEGRLTARVNLYLDLATESDYEEHKKWREEFCTDKLRIRGLKQLIDGVTSTYTGLLLEPYSDHPELTMEPVYKKEEYARWIQQGNKDGFDVRLHCIGDGAVRMALDLYEEADRINGKNPAIRNSVEHIETIAPEDIPRFKELGVIASMQPEHLPLDLNEKINRCGMERCRLEWPHRSLIDAGAILAFGTDYPVVDYNPFPGVCAAVTRCDASGQPTGVNPKERISLAEALKAYTAWAAYAYGMEDKTGTLEPGKLADIAVIDKNLFAVHPPELRHRKVVLTVMDGQVVYEM